MKDCTRQEMMAVLEPFRAAHGYSQEDMDKAIHVYAYNYAVGASSKLHQVAKASPFQGYVGMGAGATALYLELVRALGRAMYPQNKSGRGPAFHQPVARWKAYSSSSKGEG